MAKKKIFIIAGENSGDMHGGNLVKAARSLDPEIEFFGLGGKQLEKAGTRLLANIVEKLAIIGFVEVIKNIHKILDLFKLVRKALKKEKPDAIILIDYPGFNIRVAKIAKEMGIKVIYYISPQVWAWKKKRIFEIAKCVDKMMVVFPFEVELYKNVGVDVEYVGHPLFDVMRLTMNKQTVCEKFGIDPNKPIVGLLPGSRNKEILALLSEMVHAAEIIKETMPDVQFVIPLATTVSRSLVQRIMNEVDVDIKVIDEFRYNVRSTFDFAIVVSGTATLETAFLNCPMIIVYKVAFLTWLIAKNIVNLPYIGLVNVVAGDMVVPELLQDEATAQKIADKTIRILSDPEEIARIKYELTKIKVKMGGPGASKKAAAIVVDLVNKDR